MKRLLTLAVLALLSVSVVSVSVSKTVHAGTCYGSESKTSRAWDGTNYIWMTLQDVPSNDVWGNCQYQFRLITNSSNGGAGRALWAQADIRVWVCGTQVQPSSGNGPWYGYGGEWVALTNVIGGYGSGPGCAPQVDNYLSWGKTDATGSSDSGPYISFP